MAVDSTVGCKNKWQKTQTGQAGGMVYIKLLWEASSWKIYLTNEFWVFGAAVLCCYWEHSLGICMIFLNSILNAKSVALKHDINWHLQTLTDLEFLLNRANLDKCGKNKPDPRNMVKTRSTTQIYYYSSILEFMVVDYDSRSVHRVGAVLKDCTVLSEVAVYWRGIGPHGPHLLLLSSSPCHHDLEGVPILPVSAPCLPLLFLDTPKDDMSNGTSNSWTCPSNWTTTVTTRMTWEVPQDVKTG